MSGIASEVVTAAVLADTHGKSARQIQRYAALVREYTEIQVESPSGDGYLPEAVAEIERGLGFGGPGAYEKVLKAEAAERSACRFLYG